MNFLIHFKNSLFGLVSVIWGFFFLVSAEVGREVTFNLLLYSFSPVELGLVCIAVGLIHIVSKFYFNELTAAFANILLAFIYLAVLLSHLYASFYALAWIAFAAIVLNQIINAYLLMKGE